jgi:hypothetical protein
VPLALAAAAAIAIFGRVPAHDGSAVAESSRVVSGAAPSSASFGDIDIELAVATALVTRHEADRPVVVLERGTAWFTVAPRGERPAVQVRAGDATIRVIGTRFRVTRTDAAIEVEVAHGTVEVQFEGRVNRLGALQRWSSQSPDRISTAAPALPPAPPSSPAALPSSPAAPPSPPAAPPSPPRPAAPALPASPSRRAVPLPAATPLAAPDADRGEYDRLAALEATAPEVALAGYLALSRRAGRWADPALFAAARLAFDRGDRRARALLESYVQRFPRGANATDARQLLARTPDDSP